MPIGQTLANLGPLAGGVGGLLLGGPIGGIVGAGAGMAARDIYSDYAKQSSPAEQARAQLLQQLQGPVPYQRVNFDPLAQEEMRRFQRETLPSIANQFGGLGALNSSGYRQALSGAGQDLQTRLAALRAQHEIGQNQFMTGSEERRRQMLGNLAGGIFGEEQATMMNRQNPYNQLAGALPGAFMDMARFRGGLGQQGLGNVLQQLVNQQSQQNMGINQAGQLGNQGMDKAFENLMRQDPTRAQKALNIAMQILGQGVQMGGQIGAAALM